MSGGLPEADDEAESADAVVPTVDGRRRRPAGIILLMTVAILQGLLLLALGSVVLAERDVPAVAEAAGGDATLLALAAGVMIVVGLVRIGMGVLLGRGTEWVRSLFGGLSIFQVALSSYAVVALADFSSVFGLSIAILELWLLYGSPRSREFFRA